MPHQTLLVRTFRWLWVIALLMLLFASAAPATPARAQGAPLEVKLLRPAKVVICLGESVPYLIELRRLTPIGQVVTSDQYLRPILPGESVAAASSNHNAGQFIGTGRMLRSFASSTGVMIPTLAEFTFKPKEIGRTTLTFSAEVDGSVVNATTLDVRVQPCEITVHAQSRWWGATPYGTIGIAAATQKITMPVGEDGHYQAKGRYTMLYRYLVQGCSYSGSIGNGEVNVRGFLDERNLLNVTVTYAPVTFNETATCPLGTMSFSSSAELYPLKGILAYFKGAQYPDPEHQIDLDKIPLWGPGTIYLIVTEKKP